MASGRAWASSVEAPAAAVGDATDLLDVDVDQFAWPVALVTDHRLGGAGAVTAVEAATAGRVQDALHCRGRQAGLVSDVLGTPTVTATQLQHSLGHLGSRPIR